MGGLSILSNVGLAVLFIFWGVSVNVF